MHFLQNESDNNGKTFILEPTSEILPKVTTEVIFDLSQNVLPLS